MLLKHKKMNICHSLNQVHFSTHPCGQPEMKISPKTKSLKIIQRNEKEYMSFLYTIPKFLLSLTFDEQTDKKRYTSTVNRTHDQDWFTWPVL